MSRERENAAAAEESKLLPAVVNKENWYKGCVDYWDRQPTTVDGVLGGYGDIHEVESDTSRAMIIRFRHLMPSTGAALDCGAGIGRISK